MKRTGILVLGFVLGVVFSIGFSASAGSKITLGSLQKLVKKNDSTSLKKLISIENRLSTIEQKLITIKSDTSSIKSTIGYSGDIQSDIKDIKSDAKNASTYSQRASNKLGAGFGDELYTSPFDTVDYKVDTIESYTKSTCNKVGGFCY